MKKNNLHSPTFSIRNKVVRIIWLFFYNTLFRFSPIPFFSYRNFVLRLFGANIAKNARVYPSIKIWLPSNLTIGLSSTLGPNVIVYNQGKINIAARVIVSQGAHLCASTHDYKHSLHPLVLAPITIEDDVWVCADAFIGPYVHLAAGSVVGARAVVMKPTESWSVYSGNPAIKINNRSWSDK